MNHSTLILEYLESRTLLAGELAAEETFPTFLGCDAYEWTGMAAYGGFFFYAGGGGTITFKYPSIIGGAIGLLSGYHVGGGIRDHWFGYGEYAVAESSSDSPAEQVAPTSVAVDNSEDDHSEAIEDFIDFAGDCL